MDICYRKMKPGEEGEISRMVVECFDRFVAPGYSPQGVEEFHKYSKPARLADRSRQNYFVLAAWLDKRAVGMIEVRDCRHISMFYVDDAFHRRGIGKKMHYLALQTCMREKPDLEVVSVLSSPYAVPIYERLGFHSTGPDQYEFGTHFIPMVMQINQEDGSQSHPISK